MQGKIILNLAISLDGYISRDDGSYDWIVGHKDSSLNTEKEFSFEKFLEDIDVVVMGRNCYDQGFYKDFGNKKVYVATSRDISNYDNIEFINSDIVKIIEKEKTSGRNIFLFGGGALIDSFIKDEVIDEYIVGIVPIILGKGRPLFLGNNPEIALHLDECLISDGIPVLKYSKRK